MLGDQGRGETSGSIAEYVDLLCEEISLTGKLVPPCLPLETIFFGGGTPSLLSVSQLGQLLNRLERSFGIAANVEISMEMDPGTFDWDHLRGYQRQGVNRVSLGVQSFDDRQLAACGRTHRAADIRQAIDWLHQASLSIWSLDLISGLPNQTLADWRQGLETAIAQQPPHISVYDLTVEPQTVFARRYQPGVAPLPSDDDTADMYRLAQAVLTANGYRHYEISNYAKPGHQCRHNRAYWENRPFYGFGMGAASYLHGQRISRPRTRREYRQWVGNLTRDRRLPEEPISAAEALQEQLMVGLRLAEGVSLSDFKQAARERLLACLQPYLKKGWVILEDVPSSDRVENVKGERVSRLRLSDPEGFLFSNQVLIALFETCSRDR